MNLKRLATITAVLLAGCLNVGVDERDEDGTTALMRAARRGDTAAVKRLIADGADVNAEVPQRDVQELITTIGGLPELPTSDIGFTPLLYAAKTGQTRAARILIAHGAHVHHKDRWGVTAMDFAVKRSAADLVQALTSAGARPRQGDLDAAVAKSPPAVVQLILRSGVNPNRRPDPPWDPARKPLLIAATIRGEPAVVEALLAAKTDVNARDRDGWTALRWAYDAKSRDDSRNARKIIALLEAAGARDSNGIRAAALFDAVARNDVRRVRSALRAGVDPNVRDKDGATPLVRAAWNGSREIVDVLLGAGAFVNFGQRYGPRPLTAAIRQGHADIVKTLLAAGATNDQRDHQGYLPITAATEAKRADIVGILLADSVRVTSRALTSAVWAGDTVSVRLLLDYGAPIDSSVVVLGAIRPCRLGHSDHPTAHVLRLLLDRGAKAHVEWGQQTVLHIAAAFCKDDAVRLLAERGAKLNARDYNRMTPLMLATMRGKIENVRVLVAAGADLNLKDKGGQKAIDYARGRPALRAELERAMTIAKGDR